jgi:hypothetical protein
MTPGGGEGGGEEEEDEDEEEEAVVNRLQDAILPHRLGRRE